jgi:hypothetical protein
MPVNGGSERAWMPGLFGEAWMLDPGDGRTRPPGVELEQLVLAGEDL